MGEKGDRKSSQAGPMADRLVDSLASLGEVTSKAMFGGFGVFADGVMFAIVDPEGGSFLRTAESNVAAYEAAGATKHGRMPYHSVPAGVLNDDATLLAWAGEALAAARAAKGQA